MKISKLFHWLYALVMLLPIFAIGSTILYTAFNKNAYKSYAGYNEETVEYENLDNFEYYKEYTLVNTPYTIQQQFYIDYEYINLDKFTGNDTQKDLIINCDRIYFRTNGTDFVFYQNNSYKTEINVNNVTLQMDIVVTSSNMLTTENIEQFFKQKIINGNITIDNVFYYAVDKVTESPLFSWAYDSFLAAPLVYIVTLFSIPANHIVVELLSYWLAISVIWLVFDLIMYVPLLVHRWLDKGILE